MRREFPEMGETMVWGQLRSMGIQVTREWVRDAVRQTDPLSTALRWRGGLTRRKTYSVPGPNSLWHIGNCQYNNNLPQPCCIIILCIYIRYLNFLHMVYMCDSVHEVCYYWTSELVLQCHDIVQEFYSRLQYSVC